MAKLWDATQGGKPLSLDDFVPPSTEPLVEVIHHGKNSLAAFVYFQKRFCRPKDPDAKDTLVGFNFQWHGAATGPGYFVTHPSADPGVVEIDYTLTPKEKAETWPPIQPSSARLGRFIYQGTIDIMHRVSSHVTVGRAKGGQMDGRAWFVLVREDPQPPPS